MARRLRIGLVFGNPLIREGRRMLLQSQSDFDIVYEESDGLVALEALDDLAVDVLLVDNRLRSLSGTELIRRYLRRSVGVTETLPAFVLTGPFGSGQMALEAIRCGANDMVSEEESADALLEAIRRAGARDQGVDIEELRDFFESEGVPYGANQRWLLRLANLNDDDTKVLEGLALGLETAQIEQKYNLPHTKVRWSLDSLQARLGLATRAQLILALFEAGQLGNNED